MDPEAVNEIDKHFFTLVLVPYFVLWNPGLRVRIRMDLN